MEDKTQINNSVTCT